MNRTCSRPRALGASAALLAAGLACVLAPSAVTAQKSQGGGAVLTVSGQGALFQLTSGSGEAPPSIGTVDSEGNTLPDGTYTWQLEILPDARTARKLRIAASKNGGIAPEPLEPETGVFTILNGSIVTENTSASPLVSSQSAAQAAGGQSARPELAGLDNGR